MDWISPLAETNEILSVAREAMLIGRADQYRFGEMLMPHVLGRLLHLSKMRCAGLVATDLSSHGGHAVRNYGECALEMKGARLKMIHFGGDILGIDLVDGYRSAAMGEEAARFEGLEGIGGREELLRHVRRRTGQISDFAYVLEDAGEFHGAELSFHAVGLSEPERLSIENRERLLTVLKRAQFVGIRDENGADFLEKEGIAVERMPCALSVLPQVCARQLRESRDRPALVAMRNRFPNGWMAVETSQVKTAEKERLAAALRETADREGLGIVFFEADRLEGAWQGFELRQWVESFPEWQAAEFPSTNLWEIASLLLHSRLYCGRSLEARIVCMSGGIARINIPGGGAEAISYCEAWEHDSVPIEFAPDEDWAGALDEALGVEADVLQTHATWLHERYRQSFDRFCVATGMEPMLVPDRVRTRETPARFSGHRSPGLLSGIRDEWEQRLPQRPRGAVAG